MRRRHAGAPGAAGGPGRALGRMTSPSAMTPAGVRDGAAPDRRYRRGSC